MSTDIQRAAAAYAIEQIHVLVDQLREAWGWLQDLTEPGATSRPPTRAMTDELAEQLEARGHSDRAYREYNLAHGMSALPPSPAPVRLAIIDAQAAVTQSISTAVNLLADTGGEQTRARADAALGTVPASLDWLAGVEVGLGRTGRDGVWLRKVGAIRRIRDAQLAADVEKLLTRANQHARTAAGLDDDEAEQLLDPDTTRPARCPACRKRSLQRESTGLIRCVSQSCRCTGDATPDQRECGCLRAEKRFDLAHVWIRSAEDELWAAIAAAPVRQRGRRGVGRGADGHGGWQSRGMGANPMTAHEWLDKDKEKR